MNRYFIVLTREFVSTVRTKPHINTLIHVQSVTKKKKSNTEHFFQLYPIHIAVGTQQLSRRCCGRRDIML